ncbi:MAG: signal peptidase I, partial [Flavobacteriaceae bacterium]|nr:signal peptidase I [Flavobacteriaceae bacterium]
MYTLQDYSIFAVVANVLYFATTWKLFQKAGRKAWEALIPVYNILATLKIIHRPWWWIIIVFIPIVGWIMAAIILVDFVRHFGRRSFLDAVLAFFFSFVFLAYLNYSPQTQYTGKEARKETLISAVLYAVIFATIIHAFIIQPFTIPTGSMERTLLVGDFLFVSKLNYGVRIPMTPAALPFLQNKIFFFGGSSPQNQPDSYINDIRLPYMRLPGWEKVERYDIVVFNYPPDSLHAAIDRKDPYVKRCVGVPGDKIQIINNNLYINGQPEKISPDEEQQRRYKVFTNEIGIGNDRVMQLFGYTPYGEVIPSEDSNKREYIFEGLTKENVAKLKANLNTVDSIVQIVTPKGITEVTHFDYSQKIDTTNSIFPINSGWNHCQYGPLTLPKKGDIIQLTPQNIEQYKKIIKVYEHNDLKINGNQFYINDVPANTYTFKQNYYWMMGDNRDNSLDSRYFGYVPEDHIIGKPVFTWFSLQGAFENDRYGHPAERKIRWDRMFRIPNNGVSLSEKTNYGWIILVLLVVFFGYDYFRGKKKGEKE